MKIINTVTGETVAEIMTNHSITLDEAIDLVGRSYWDDSDQCLDVLIDGKSYDYDELDIRAKEEADAYELTPGGMKPYWCVTTSVDNRGRVVANITNTTEAVYKPENSFTSTSRRDIYNDWFDSREAAENHVMEARKA